MQRRFTLIQGGLIKHWAGAAAAEPIRDRGWRIDLRRPSAVDGPTFAAWRDLAEAQLALDPFAHPDYVLTAARHGGRGVELAFAFAYEPAPEGAEILSGVLPLLMPHPVWGRSARLWQPTMAQAPVEPLLRGGTASLAIEALLRHLRTINPRVELRLDRIEAAGRFLRELTGSERLRLDTRIDHMPIPSERIVGIRRIEAVDRIESVTEPSGIRDAVERFLLADAEGSRRPILADPAAAAIARVVPRLFAYRGWACIELGWKGETIVSAAIRLGRQDGRVLWRSVGLREAVQAQRMADADIRLAEGLGELLPAARLRLVGS